ncbi:MAG TPA: PAS domain-containing protein, partial [Herpetosiphonaceae bacterium]
MATTRFDSPDGTADHGSSPMDSATESSLTAFCRTLIDQSQLPSALLVGPEFHIQCVSPAFAVLMGQAAAELCGRPMRDSAPRIGAGNLLETLEQVSISGEARSCRQTLPPNQQHEMIAWTAMLYPLPAGSGAPPAIFMELHDTTDQQLATQLADDIRAINEQLVLTQIRAHETAEQLREHLAFLQALTQSLHDGVYAVDPEGRVSYVNASAERMLGQPAAALIGRPAA